MNLKSTTNSGLTFQIIDLLKESWRVPFPDLAQL